MSPTIRKWLKFSIRWGIAVAGIWYVLAHINLSDRVMILNPADRRPVWAKVVGNAAEQQAEYQIITPGGTELTIQREELWTQADERSVKVRGPDGAVHQVELLAMKPRDPGVKDIPPALLLVEDPETGNGVIIDPDEVVGGYTIRVPYPIVDVGITRRVREADPALLWVAILVFPLTFIITAIRWHALLRPLQINMTLARCFALNWVGMFYSTFMPGSTGGDLVKAYYAAKQTTNRTRAVMSVLIDRIIGLLALILLGGTMAAVQYFIADNKAEAVARSSLKVAILCGLILAGTFVALVLFFNAWTRKYLGLDLLLRKLPMQTQVQKAIEVMAIYRQRPMLVLGALLASLPVHATVVVSAMFAGKAFDLPLAAPYYFVAVPVIVLVGSIPISPQGAGVMEFFAIRLTERHGVTIAQAFILTMSIRLVQIMWNLVGGLFALRGDYQAPTEAQARDLNLENTADSSAVASPES